MKTRARGATARAVRHGIAASPRPRVLAAVGVSARTVAHEPDPGAPTAAGVVADLLEALAQRLRQAAEHGEDALAILRHPLGDVDGQPYRLKAVHTANSTAAAERGDALLTAEDLAARLRCKPRTLRRWRHLGWVPEPITIGRAVRWRARDIDRWEARRRT